MSAADLNVAAADQRYWNFLLAGCSGGLLGICSTIAGMVILLITRRERKTFVMVSAVLLNDAFFGFVRLLYYMTMLRFLIDDKDDFVIWSSLQCSVQIHMALTVLVLPSIALMPLALAIERFIAVFRPVWYRGNGRWLSLTLIVSAYAICILWLAAVITANAFATATVNPSSCSLSFLIGTTGRRIFYATRIVLITISVLAYVPIYVRLSKQPQKIAVTFISPNQKTVLTAHQSYTQRLNRSAALNAVNITILFILPDLYFTIIDANITVIWISAIANVSFAIRGIVTIFIFTFANRAVLWQAVKSQFIGSNVAFATDIATGLRKKPPLLPYVR